MYYGYNIFCFLTNLDIASNYGFNLPHSLEAKQSLSKYFSVILN
jgi:hypothetical protein